MKKKIGEKIKMLHIAIEGMDGVGKTTVCKLLAQKTGFIFVEKPLHYLFDDNESEVIKYQAISEKVNHIQNRNVTAWYYGFNNIYLYEKFKNNNIITDRHIVSNYCWSGTTYNDDIYDLIIKKIGKPTITIILYASPNVIFERLKKRNINDSDISKIEKCELAYEKMIYFCEVKKLKYLVIDTSDKEVDDIISLILDKIKEII